MAIVLAIDDQPAQRLILGRCLFGLGFHVQLADTGELGIAFAKRFKPDAIMLDWSLGDGLSGEDTLKALKADPLTKGIPVVMISAYREGPDPFAWAFEHDAIFLEKQSWCRPESMKQLKTVLDTLIRKRRELGSGWMADQPRTLVRGCVRVDLITRYAWVTGRRVCLGPKRFDLLCALMNAKGVVPREKLRIEVWGAKESTKTVDMTMSRLRDDLRKVGGDFIVTAPQGYLLVG